MSQTHEANKGKIKTLFFETAVDPPLFPPINRNSCIGNAVNGLMENRILISHKMFPQPSDGIKH